MSTRNVELIHIRLREELDRLQLKPAAAAKAAGEPDSQGLRDVLGGRKRLSAELLAGLVATSGVDARYVLAGQRSDQGELLTSEERYLIDRYRASQQELRDAVLRVLLGGVEGASPKKIGKQVQVSVGTNHGQMAEKITNKK